MPDHARETGIAMEKTYQFMLWLIPTVEKFPRSLKFSLGDRVLNAGMEVLEGIIDATYSRKKVFILRQTNLTIEKLRVLFRLTMGLRVITPKKYEFAIRSLDEIGRLIGGWMKSSHAAETP